MSGRDDVQKQIAAMRAKFKERAKFVRTEKVKAVERACLMIEVTAKRGMTDTEVDSSVSYAHGHHPSVPGAYPAVDIGTLRMSVTHSVEAEGTRAVGRVGSTITDPPYGFFLEMGTSRMSARPWLLPSIDKNRDKIREMFAALVKGKDASSGGDNAGE